MSLTMRDENRVSLLHVVLTLAFPGGANETTISREPWRREFLFRRNKLFNSLGRDKIVLVFFQPRSVLQLVLHRYRLLTRRRNIIWLCSSIVSFQIYSTIVLGFTDGEFTSLTMFSLKYVLSNISSSPKRSINLWAGRGTLWKICLAIVKCCSILFRKNKSPVFTWSNIYLPLLEGIKLPQALKLLNSLKSISP